MFKRSENSIKDVAGLLVAAYMVGVMLYGMWSMMQHLHWVVPFLLVGAAVGTQKVWLAAANALAATVMAVYGLAVAQHLHWFKAAMFLLMPLVVVQVISTVVLAWLKKRNAPQA